MNQKRTSSGVCPDRPMRGLIFYLTERAPTDTNTPPLHDALPFPTAAPTRTIALSMRASSATAAIPRDGRAGGGGGTGFARKTPTAGTPPIEPRARAPLVLPRERASLSIRAAPLGPGRAVPPPRPLVSAPAQPHPGPRVD